MITNSSVFEDDTPPRELMYREAEVEALHRAWKPTLGGQAGDEVIISGSSGVGKTSLAQHTIERIEAQTETAHAYVQCLGASPQKILATVLQAHPTASFPAGEESLAALTETLRDAVSHPYIVILDEAEGLPDLNALDRLADVPQLSTVVIVHNPTRWRSRLSNEAVSERYIDATDVEVDKFGVDELADILRARARVGLQPGVVDRSQLEWIADEVAGVARYGIQSLRAAAEHAADRGAFEIEAEDIEACFELAQRRIREINLRSLTVHHHILYALIHAAGSINGVELHERYDAVAEQVYADTTLTPIVRRTRRDRLRKLEEYELITQEGTGVARYEVADASVQPPIDVSVAASVASNKR
ncbi:AAA family ATPase [Halobellus sp. H-GB7]|uniref:Cdc6/Cdc18 family protein n=1 Tax=Halobellus sp. H-GB7 TaxID=3069756 RepID=UPI0027AFA807|nr:AAA family ATPase [Halobellus sp. H-GB7]MDQ2053207.1 AAA family ATPase [Halobellus sp. H-GB7]